MDDLKQAVCEGINKAATELHDISQDIWSNPELNYEEKHAHDVLTSYLEKKGFHVDKKYKIDTAFRASIGSKDNGPHVAVICEYDALPEIGHACGHNLIAESGVAAGIGVKAAFEKAGKPLGCLSVIGTPAEEGGGGKVVLIKEGVFDDVDVAMMLHPAPMDASTADFMMAVNMVKIKYIGKASHAAAFPWEGINALDAAVTCYQTISNLRQQMKPSWRVHGIISKGGVKPNIIPEEAELEYYIRTQSKSDLDLLTKKCVECFESAAKSTGCKVEIKFGDRPYLNVISNLPLAEVFTKNCKLVGTGNHTAQSNSLSGGSTDMGNVSYVVPSIHPCFYIGSDAVNHTRDFTKAAGDEKAQPYTLAQSKAMAMSAIDVFTNQQLLQDIESKFKDDIKTA
ncbi:hypothetical protein FSP39_005982 [Pinctada imbricata]|uniref:Peptidase M20 domain-containing protein 2 n=1 Tax=Pinctada imbricata TaxID=66713 RepID=A0AA88Y2X4_PINIB|nr:hypothetical protein FSP39_005982 [Pinctada imbricata]